jgi:hypothetical protein
METDDASSRFTGEQIIGMLEEQKMGFSSQVDLVRRLSPMMALGPQSRSRGYASAPEMIVPPGPQ